jgi:hypothetical protein
MLAKKRLLSTALIILTLGTAGYSWHVVGANAEQNRVDDELNKMKKKTRDAAEKAFKAWDKQARPVYEIPTTYLLAVRLLHAELEMAEKKQDRISAHEAHLRRMKDWEKWVSQSAPGSPPRPPGISPPIVAVEFFRQEAELWLAKEQSK